MIINTYVILNASGQKYFNRNSTKK